MDRPNIRTPSDLLSLPKFAGSIDPVARPLKRIITPYYLDSEFPCGLKSCHRPHREGYLVELNDGGLTNIGHICGGHFGEAFTIEERRYVEQVQRPELLAALKNVTQRIQAELQTLKNLEAQAATLSNYKSGFRNTVPKLHKELERRAHTGNNRVTSSVERSKQEIEDLMEITPGLSRERLRYREEVRGVLLGLSVLAVNVRETVISKLTAKAQQFLETEVGILAIKDLMAWDSWGRNFDTAMQEAKAIVEAGAAFFSPESFRLMAFIATDQREKSALAKMTTKSLLGGASSVSGLAGNTINPANVSKKQRDIQKKMFALQRK